MEEAKQRECERRAQAAIEARGRRAREAFFNELSRRAQALEGDERASLDARILAARALAGGQEAVDRFLNWTLPPGSFAPDEDAADDDGVD